MLLLLVLACGKDPSGESGGGEASAYTPTAGTVLEYAPEGEMQAVYGDDTAAASPSPVSLLRVTVMESTWEIARDGVATDSLPWTLGDDGLQVGDSHLLPAKLGEGVSADGVSVSATGSDEVWYGTFAVTATVAVEAGELAGVNTVAEALGPVRVSFRGEAWELVYYERPSE